MNRTKYLQGPCAACGTLIRFPADSIGLTATCPHCKRATELVLGAPPQEGLVPRKAILWTSIALVILVGGLVGSIAALHRLQGWAARHPAQRPTVAQVVGTNSAGAAAEANLPMPFGLRTSGIRLQRDAGRLFAVGQVTNNSNQTHSGVKLEIKLLDAAGQAVGSATAYRHLLAPGAEWEFKVPAPAHEAVSARLGSIAEGQ